MDIIIEVIELGSLLGIGFYIGFEGIHSLLKLLALGIKLIINKTLETQKCDDEWSDERVGTPDKSHIKY